MPTVSIEIKPDVFDRFSDLNFKSSQAIAEFIDNAIQSYLDNKNNNTFYVPGYKLIVDVHIKWAPAKDHKTYAESIEIRDNAAGISNDKFQHALETGHRPPFNEGLNEYGMGMKVAAYWLSKNWTIKTKSYAETTERTVSLDVDDIVQNKRTQLQYEEKEVTNSSSYTIVSLTNLHEKNNFTKAKFSNIKQELASIYRGFLRRNEIQINIQEDDNAAEALQFTDYKLLTCPYYGTPKGNPIKWSYQINIAMFGKEIHGYIAILDESSEKHSGLVVMRRGRVIVGESTDHLYHPACLFSTSKNSFQYKRLYGELEIKGFRATFNKNGFSNLEELETMLGTLKGKINVEGYSLIKQAQNLRVREPNNGTGSTGTGSTGTGSTNAGSTSAGSTSAGSTNAGSTSAGSTSAGSTSAGSTSAGSTGTGDTSNQESTEFSYNGAKYTLEFSVSSGDSHPVEFEMSEFDTKNKLRCIFSPFINKVYNTNEESRKIITALAIGMFKAQMSEEDSCEGLIKQFSKILW